MGPRVMHRIASPAFRTDGRRAVRSRLEPIGCEGDWTSKHGWLGGSDRDGDGDLVSAGSKGKQKTPEFVIWANGAVGSDVRRPAADSFAAVRPRKGVGRGFPAAQPGWERSCSRRVGQLRAGRGDLRDPDGEYSCWGGRISATGQLDTSVWQTMLHGTDCFGRLDTHDSVHPAGTAAPSWVGLATPQIYKT